jgi:hypothetical protein
MVLDPTAPHRSASDNLSLISENKVSPQDAQQVLHAAFTAEDYVHCVKNLNERNIDPQAYIDSLDRVRSRPPILMKNTSTAIPYQIIDELPPGSGIYHRCLRALRKACGIYGILPSSHLMSEGLTLVVTGDHKNRPSASGGFSDVWKARDDAGHIFAIKKFRTYEFDEDDYLKKVRTSDRSLIIPRQSLFSRDFAKRSSSVDE